MYKKVNIILIFLLNFANFFDAILTKIAIKSNLAYESNPIMRFVIDYCGLNLFVVFKISVVFLLSLVLYKFINKILILIIIGLIIFYGSVVLFTTKHLVEEKFNVETSI